MQMIDLQQVSRSIQIVSLNNHKIFYLLSSFFALTLLLYFFRFSEFTYKPHSTLYLLVPLAIWYGLYNIKKEKMEIRGKIAFLVADIGVLVMAIEYNIIGLGLIALFYIWYTSVNLYYLLKSNIDCIS